MPSLPSGDIAQKAIAAVEKFRTRVEEENQEQHELFVELHELYTIKSRQQDIEPWLSKLKPTAAFEFVERAHAALVSNTPSFELESTSSDTPKVELEPEIVDDRSLGGDGSVLREAVEIDFAEIYEADLMQMFRVRSMKKFLRAWIKDCLTHGTAHCEIEMDVVARKEYEALFEEGNEEDEDTDFTVILDKITPKPCLVENYDVLVSPYAHNPKHAVDNYGGFGLAKHNVSLRDLDEDTYGNLERLRATLSSHDKNISQEEKSSKQRTVSETGDEVMEKSFTVYEVYMWMDEGEKEDKLKVIAVSNGVLLRYDDADDELPYVKMDNQEIPHQYWGIGEIEPIKEEIYEEITLRNQRIDMNNRLLNEDWLVDTNSGVDVRQLTSSHQRIILTDDINGVQQLQRNSTGLATSGEDIDRARRNMATTTGSVDTIAASGNLGGDTKTATGERIREQNAIARYNSKAENIEFAVAELARKMLKAKAEHLNEKDKVPVFLRGKWREVDASLYKEYIDKFIIRVRSGSMNIQNSITERNKKITLKNIGLEAKQIGLPVNLDELYRQVFADFKGVDVDKILPQQSPQQLQGGAPSPTAEQSLEGLINEIPGAQIPGPQLEQAQQQQEEQANPLA